MQNDSNNKKSTNWYADKPELAVERKRRRNKKYKSEPNYQVKIKTKQRHSMNLLLCEMVNSSRINTHFRLICQSM